MKNRPTIAVSGLHRGENPQPGASVIASLRRRFPGMRLVGLSYDPLESGLYGQGLDHADIAYLIPYPGVGTRALLERLEEIHAREKLTAVIPCLDSEIQNYIDLHDELKGMGIRTMLPTNAAFDTSHKANLFNFCRKIGIAAPMTKVAMNGFTVTQFAEEIGYPVYVKGRLYDAKLVGSQPDLASAYQEIVRVWGWPIIVQEAIVGEEYDIAGVGDGRGGILSSCTIRKMLRTSHGKGFAGIVIDNPELDSLARLIIRKLKWSGPFELEFLKAAGKPYTLFEINPRFPAWIDFPSQIGCNMPAIVGEHLLGVRSKGSERCAVGRMFVRHSVDVVGDFADFAAMSASGMRLIGGESLGEK